MSWKKHVIIIVVLSVLWFIVFSIFDHPKETSEVSQAKVTGEFLSSEDYVLVRIKYLELVVSLDPREALSQLREEIKTDDPLLRSCHALVHEMGHAAYEKYKSFGEAMVFQDEICNSAYLHGVIESYFDESPDVRAALASVCGDYPVGKFKSWECYHGVGHGAMFYTNNDLPKSLTLCESYDTDFARGSCVNGVFMENFNTDQKAHFSQFLDESDPFYPCGKQKIRYKTDCYLYAPTYYLSLNRSAYSEALLWCQGAPFGAKNICAHGVGSEAIKQNINEPLFVERVCTGGPSSLKDSCIEGMVGLYINHFGALEPGRVLCESLRDENRSVCLRTVQVREHFFE